jgi:hypothetical protein
MTSGSLPSEGRAREGEELQVDRPLALLHPSLTLPLKGR